MRPLEPFFIFLSSGIGMHVEIRDPDDKIILSKVYSTEGKWTFTSSTPGSPFKVQL
jgi:p24 family protein alpha